MKHIFCCLGLLGLAGSLVAAEVSSQWLQANRARRWDAKAQVLTFAPKENALVAFANRAIRARVTADFNAFTTEAKKRITTPPKTPWFLDLDANLAHQDANLISVWYEHFERRELGKEKRDRWVMNFARMGGTPKQVTLTELSGGLPDALKARILDMVNMERELNGGEPTAWRRSFSQNVVLTKQSLVLILLPEEVASSRDQIHKLYISLTEASEMSAENSPIRQLRRS